MKATKLFVVIFILFTAQTGCKKLFTYKCDAGRGSTNVIGLNETVCSKEDDFAVTFTDVVYDDRCFSGACTNFNGVAKLRFSFKHKRQTTTFHLYTSNTNGYYADTTISGYEISLGVVTPEPVAGQVFPDKDYKIEITVR